MASARISSPQSLNRYSYVLNNPLRLTDPSGMVCQDPQLPTPKPIDTTVPPPPLPPLPTPSLPPISIGPVPLPLGIDPVPTSISIKVGELQQYNGEIIRYANGNPVLDENDQPVSGYGFGRTVTITVLDQGDNSIDPEGVTLTETVTVNSATPADARRMALQKEDRPVPIRPGGIVEDIHGIISPIPLPANLPPFTVQTTQNVDRN